MSTEKEEVLRLVKEPPDDVPLEDIPYHLYVLQKIRKGLKDSDEGWLISQEDMEKRFERWLVP